jgi:hypothetical protein
MKTDLSLQKGSLHTKQDNFTKKYLDIYILVEILNFNKINKSMKATILQMYLKK